MKTASEKRDKVQEIPDELLRSSPRPVVLRAGGKAVVVIAVLLAAGAVAAVVLLYNAAARDAHLRQQMMDESVHTQAQVIHLGRTRGKDPQRIIRYQYASDGRVYQCTVRVGLRQLRELQVGSPLMVAYLASRPEVSWIPGYEPHGTPWLVVPLIPAGLLFPAGMLAYSLRRQSALLAEGRPALARVLKSTRLGGKRGSHNRVEMEFKLLSGAIRTGRLDMRRSPATGSNIVILYDPEQPKRLMSYPSPLVRLDIPI